MMLVGPSGCGKTTLISVITGLLERDDGEARLLGQDFNQMSGRERTHFRGRHVGFVFQSFDLIPALTAAENAAIPLLIAGMPRQAALVAADALLERMDFDARMRQALPHDLSGGQKQRVAIARSVIHQPKVIVCDEPTSALDADAGRKVMQLLKTLVNEQERVLVVVTHDARIFEFADRIVRMEDGRLLEPRRDSERSLPQSGET